MISEYVKVCHESELSEGTTKVIEIDGDSVILAKHDGVVYAVEGYCSHDSGEFKGVDNHFCDGQIECPRHHGRFDIKTGEATRMPAVAPISTYDVKIENGEVFVSIEER
ncbi:MAG: Rieske 2Fe-2S domain-containing protein [candidate division Zixibacteria bacterium]|nr:Rieske 2Fe-2S domain-containing protein [candidate division Zixibacteria bacterium]